MSRARAAPPRKLAPIAAQAYPHAMRSRVPTAGSPRGALAVVAVAVAGVACSRADSAADRHFAEMREAITEVQADQDRANRRLELLDVGVADEPPSRRAPEPSPRPAPLRTVQLGDADPGGEGDDPNDPTARPAIRLEGSSMGSPRPLRGKTTREDVRVAPRSEAGAPPIMDPEAKESYDRALALVGSKQYDRALDALAGFLVRWPDHPYAENALYWRGEVYFARGEHLRAAEQFEGVLARFGGGNKAPDALLKIGMSHERLGSPERAREYWERLRRDYPRSDAAKKIPQRSDEPRSRGAGPKESR